MTQCGVKNIWYWWDFQLWYFHKHQNRTEYSGAKSHLCPSALSYLSFHFNNKPSILLLDFSDIFPTPGTPLYLHRQEKSTELIILRQLTEKSLLTSLTTQGWMRFCGLFLRNNLKKNLIWTALLTKSLSYFASSFTEFGGTCLVTNHGWRAFFHRPKILRTHWNLWLRFWYLGWWKSRVILQNMDVRRNTWNSTLLSCWTHFPEKVTL